MVVIDIDMPKDCWECPFKKNYRTNDYGSHCECEWDDKYRTINLLEHSKPTWCPLKEAPNIDDIKAEIEDAKYLACGQYIGTENYMADGLDKALEIIDKHISGKENE